MRTYTAKAIVMTLLGGVLILSEQTKAQVDNGGTTEPQELVVAVLEKEKQIEQLKKEIAEAKRDALLAQLPSSETTGAAGAVTFKEKAGYFADLMAYGTLSTAAAKIATAMGEGKGKTVVITDELQLTQKVHLWQLIRNRLKDFEAKFDKLLEETKDIKEAEDIEQVEIPAPFLAALPALLGGIADIAAFFKVDQEFIGREITLANSALHAKLAASLKVNKWNVFLPSFNTSDTGELLKMLDRLSSKRAQVAERRRHLATLVAKPLKRLAELRKVLDAKKAELDKLEKAKPQDQVKIDELKKEIEALDVKILPLATIETRWTKLAGEFDAVLLVYDEYQKTLTEGSAAKPSPIEALAVVDVIQAKENADRLFVSIVSQGAEIHVTKGAWTSGRISYLGGSVSVYFWINADGNYKGSDSIPLWEGKSVKSKNGTEELNLQ